MISLAVGAGKLFAGFFSSNSGASIVDFLKNANEQLGIINQKFDIVLRDLDELKRMVGAVPGQTVSKLSQVQLKGRINDYRAIMTEVASKAYNGNIANYMSERVNREKVETLSKELRRIKSELESLDNDPFLVPFVTMAMNMEYYLRANFLSEKWPTLIGSMALDKEWLNKYLFTNNNALQKMLQNLEAQRVAQLTNSVQLYSASYGKTVRIGNNFISSTPAPVYQRKLVIYPDGSMTEDPDAAFLRKIGLLSDRDFPFTFVVAEDKMIAVQADGQVLPPVFPITKEEDFGPALEQYRRNSLAAQKGALQQNYLSIISTAGAIYAGLKAMELCNVFLNAARAKKP